MLGDKQHIASHTHWFARFAIEANPEALADSLNARSGVTIALTARAVLPAYLPCMPPASAGHLCTGSPEAPEWVPILGLAPHQTGSRMM